MPDNRKSLIYGAFPVCRNYTVRAYVRDTRPHQRRGRENAGRDSGTHERQLHARHLHARHAGYVRSRGRHRRRLHGGLIREGVKALAKKRKAGDGLIRQRTDGRWEGRYVVGYDDHGYPKTKAVFGKSKRCLLYTSPFPTSGTTPRGGWLQSARRAWTPSGKRSRS